MAEDLKKSEELLKDEELDEVTGGAPVTKNYLLQRGERLR